MANTLRSSLPSLPMSAGEVLANYWNGSIPVNPIAVAQNMGIQIYKDSSLDVSGEFFFENGSPTIVFNPNESLTRQRFTIAHELGHFALNHGPNFRDGRNAFDANTYSLPEVFANRFAAELLMPETEVRSLALSWGQTLNSLANTFGVSTVAMKIRLQTLGIIGD